MKIAFKIHSQNPNNQTSLNMYPWIEAPIKDEESDQYIRDGWQVMNENEFAQYKATYESEVEYFANNVKDETLRVRQYLHQDFVHFHPSKIDFTLHLKPNINLIKNITMLKNGRPLVAKYYAPDTGLQICEIKFEFVNNSAGFMTKRKELLGYCRNDGKIDEYYSIHSRDYNFANITQATESLSERVQARSNIIQEIKIVLNNTLINYLISYGDNPIVANNKSLIIGKDFFNEYRFEISDFIEVASPGFKGKILLQDNGLENPKYPWLNAFVAPNVTLRMWIYDRLTY